MINRTLEVLRFCHKFLGSITFIFSGARMNMELSCFIQVVGIAASEIAMKPG